MKPERRERILKAAADVLLPRDYVFEHFLPRLRGAMYVAGVDAVNDLDLALTILDHPVTGMVFGHSLSRFSKSSLARREQTLARFQRSRVGAFRTIYLAVQRLIVSSHYSDPAVQEAIGYVPPEHAA